MSIESMLILADTAWQRGQADEALAHYRRILDGNAASSIALRRLAWLEEGRGNVAAAMELLRPLIVAEPTDARAHQDLGLCHQKLNQPKEALDCFRRATEADPNYAPAFCNLGLALEDAGDRAGAIAALRAANHLQPASSFIAYHLAAVGGSAAPPLCPPDYLTRLFDAYADRFDRHLFATLGYRGPQLLADIVGHHGPPKPWDLLDLGCGTGMTAVPFRDAARSIVGVDLSAGMLQHAARRVTPQGRPVYDQLQRADVVTALRERPASLDLILSADVFIYIGDLHPVFAACRTALRPAGLLAFTIESTPGPDDFVLRPTRRYAQSPAYISRLAAEFNLIQIDRRDATLRQGDDGHPVAGEVYLFQVPEGREGHSS